MKIEGIMEKNMQKIETTSPEAQSADIVAGNIEQLKALFPELISEVAGGVSINVEVLKALVGDKTVTDTDEKYGLNWHGKRRARQLALTPSTGTLRPCVDESVDWDTTQNLMIEGDNLEVLKLLQKSYASKIKLIYIDPPYNTGNDFVYPDNFQNGIRNYMELTGQVDCGEKISSNTETNGRFHTDWLNMMYPRLKLARNLLRDDGVIFISIDDAESSNLRKLCDDIFGEENFVEQLVWKRRATPPNDRIVGKNHEYVLVFSKNINLAKLYLQPRTEELNTRYSNPDNDKNGPWAASDLSANGKGGRLTESCIFEITNPRTGKAFSPPQNKCWLYNKEKIDAMIVENRIDFRSNSGAPFLKRYLSEVRQGVTLATILDNHGFSQDSAKEIKELFGLDIFEFPKPLQLIKTLLTTGINSSDIVLDFFAGSGTTGAALMQENATDGGCRRYILVQLPEPLSVENNNQKVAANFCTSIKKPLSIAELTKERLRRTGKKIKDDNPMFAGDTGFRVFKLDNSNIRAWNPDRDNMEKTLLDHEEHILAGRTEEDIVYELLLKLGLDLCVPMESRNIADKSVSAIGGGVLMTCLTDKITRDGVEPLAQGIVAWRKELAPAGDTTCIFRDSAFVDDVAKTNLVVILEQYGIQNVRSL